MKKAFEEGSLEYRVEELGVRIRDLRQAHMDIAGDFESSLQAIVDSRKNLTDDFDDALTTVKEIQDALAKGEK